MLFKKLAAVYSPLAQTPPQKSIGFWFFAFTLFIPILNGLANVTTNFFPPATINPGFFRIALIIVFLLLVYQRAFVANSTNLFFIGFAIYWIILIPFADNTSLNIMQAPKIVLSVLLFPIGYYYINTPEKLRLLVKSMLIAGSFFVINFIIANIFKIGYRGYGGEKSELFFGSGGINISKAISFIILLVPFFLRFNNSKLNRYFAIILVLFAIPVLLISLKRSALLAFILGALVYMFFTPYRGKTVKWLIAGFVILFLATPFYIDKLEYAFNAREESLDFENPEFTQREARVGEFSLVINLFKEGTLKHKLVGTDLIYNTYLYDGYRMLHTDYMAILYGAGLIGFLWFFGLNAVVFQKFKSYRINSVFYKETRATLYALIVATFMISIAGSVADLNFRSLFTLFAGGAIATARTMFLQHRLNSDVADAE